MKHFGVRLKNQSNPIQKEDQSITDITIKFRIIENSDLRNYLQINLSQYDRQ